MKRLIMVQQQLKAAKDQDGDKGKYKYRKAEDILEKAKPFLAQQELAVILSDSLVEIGGRLFLKASASIWGSEGICGEAFGYAELDDHKVLKYDDKSKNFKEVKSMSNEQCTGSASSYARKYALCGLFAIDNSDDDPDAIANTLMTRIAAATDVDDINALMSEIKEASEDERKAFNAQASNLGLEYRKDANKYVPKQNSK